MESRGELMTRLAQLGISSWFEGGQLVFQNNHIGIPNGGKFTSSNEPVSRLEYKSKESDALCEVTLENVVLDIK